MNYLIYNPQAKEGKCKEIAESLKVKLEPSFPELGMIPLKNFDWDAFCKTLKATDNVILLGGDGTLNRIVNSLGHSSFVCPVYFAEVGTGNDFVKDIEEEKDPKTGLFRINDYIENLPYVEVKGKTYRFLNGIGFGIDGECCVKAEEMKAEGTEDINYSSITVKLLLHGYTPRNAKVVVDGREYQFKKVYIASSMNGRYYGGGMKVAPEQKRGSGKITFVSVFGKGKIGTFLMFPGIFKGTHLKNKRNAIALVGKCIEVTFDKPTGLQIDGEVINDVLTYKAYIK